MTAQRIYSTLDIARELGVSRLSVWRWVRNGHLRATRGTGGGRSQQVRVTEMALRDFVRRWSRTANGVKTLASRAHERTEDVASEE
jgi:excisionase family DNA binding protein